MERWYLLPHSIGCDRVKNADPWLCEIFLLESALFVELTLILYVRNHGLILILHRRHNWIDYVWILWLWNCLISKLVLRFTCIRWGISWTIDLNSYFFFLVHCILLLSHPFSRPRVIKVTIFAFHLHNSGLCASSLVLARGERIILDFLILKLFDI